MKESITLFRQAINDSADLQEKCNSIQARGGTEQDLVELGKENGHEFSAEELKEAYEQLQKDEDGELTEFEMAAVAGGGRRGRRETWPIWQRGSPWGKKFVMWG